VTLEALEDAAKYAELSNIESYIENVVKSPKNYRTWYALARMLMKHEPHLIKQSFEDRTAAEYDRIYLDGSGLHKDRREHGLEQYRKYVMKHVEESGK
jgi:hypothetical protein